MSVEESGCPLPNPTIRALATIAFQAGRRSGGTCQQNLGNTGEPQLTEQGASS